MTTAQRAMAVAAVLAAAVYVAVVRPRNEQASKAEARRYKAMAKRAGVPTPIRSFVYDENVDAYYGVDARGDSFKVYSDGMVKR